MTTLIPKIDLMNGSTTPTGAINRTINAKAQDIISVKDFGAVGDGTTNDTAAIQAAINTGKSIYFPEGTYAIASKINVTVSNIHLYGVGTIKLLSSFDKSSGNMFAFYVTGNNIVFDGLSFDGSAATTATGNNAFIWTEGNRTVITKCNFYSLARGASSINCAFCCATENTQYSRADGCYFEQCPGAVFFKAHSCIAINNFVLNPWDVSFVVNGSNCTKGIIMGNTINNSSLNPCAGHIGAEEEASQWVIQGNTIFGINSGYGIGANNYNAPFFAVEGGIIDSNIINGGGSASTNPTAFIVCGPYYNNVLITNNKLYNNVTGQTSSPLIYVSATGGIVSGNYINETGSLGAVYIQPGNTSNGLQIFDNTSYASQRHYLIQPGDYNNIPILFKSNKMYSGSNGIDSTVSTTPTNLLCYFENFADCTVTNPVNLNNITNFGFRQYFINNEGAWKYPCSIKSNTVMFGDRVPTSGAWALGDTIFNIGPAAGVPSGWQCSVAGSPGTWVKMANLT